MEEPKIVLDDKDSTIINGDWLEASKLLPNDSVDLIVTDPPYGYSFMSSAWDKVVMPTPHWEACLRVLKPGAFAFVMSAPRQDVLAQAITNLHCAGFDVGYSPIAWCYSSGFPKAMNIGRAVDKRKGVIRKGAGSKGNTFPLEQEYESGEPVTDEAKILEGSYGGFQPKPAWEVILVAMKPLQKGCKTYIDQAMHNRKGITWLDDGRIPHSGESLGGGAQTRDTMVGREGWDRLWRHDPKAVAQKCERVNEAVKRGEQWGRFPANLLVEDDVLNDGSVTKGQAAKKKMHYEASQSINIGGGEINTNYGDIGSFSRYFDLDAWWAERIKQLPESAQKTFPFLVVPKANKKEKDKGLDDMPLTLASRENAALTGAEGRLPHQRNPHPTVKSLKLMSWLIIIGSREGDIILDPFLGSGTTLLAAKLLKRFGVGVELNTDYCDVAVKRLKAL